MKRMISDSQCRAARALLDASQDDVASWSGVSRGTIANYERGARVPFAPNLVALQRALEEHGVVFLDATDDRGPGVCLAAEGSAPDADPSGSGALEQV